MKKLRPAVLILLFSISFLSAGRDFLQYEGALRLDGGVREIGGSEIPVPVLLLPEEGLAVLKAQAEFIFSAMTWGMEFVYIPPWKDRSVDEVLTLTPLAAAWQPEMEMLSYNLKGLVIRSSWLLEWGEAEKQYQERWESLSFPLLEGRASALQNLPEGKYENLFSLAVKDALRSYLRKEEFTRPREVHGHILLVDYPLSGFVSGKNTLKVTIKLKINSLEKYEVF